MIRNRNLEELTTLKNAMEETMDGLWSSLQAHIVDYKESTADKRRTYGELLAKDKKGVAELSSNNTKLTRLQEEITDFKKKVNEGGADIGPEMDQLRKERESLTGVCVCSTYLHMNLKIFEIIKNIFTCQDSCTR